MKKFLIVILVIIIIFAFGFGVKKMLDKYSENDKTETKSTEDYLKDGWEVEAEYTYNGTVNESDLEYFENTEVSK